MHKEESCPQQLEFLLIVIIMLQFFLFYPLYVFYGLNICVHFNVL